jgi:hypothetical protein
MLPPNSPQFQLDYLTMTPIQAASLPPSRSPGTT